MNPLFSADLSECHECGSHTKATRECAGCDALLSIAMLQCETGSRAYLINVYTLRRRLGLPVMVRGDACESEEEAHYRPEPPDGDSTRIMPNAHVPSTSMKRHGKPCRECGNLTVNERRICPNCLPERNGQP